jgi:hypothetical protein
MFNRLFGSLTNKVKKLTYKQQKKSLFNRPLYFWLFLMILNQEIDLRHHLIHRHRHHLDLK